MTAQTSSQTDQEVPGRRLIAPPQPREAGYSRIIGTGSYLPDRAMHNRELEHAVQTTDEWIFSRTGIRSRHLAAPGEQTSDLAWRAARAAIASAGIGVDEVDLVVVATCTPDMVFPSTACLVQRKLGITRGAAFDVNAVCTGFVYALALADKLVASGQHRCAVVIGADIFSRLLDWTDRRTCVLFGDGAGAVVIRHDRMPGILSSHLNAEAQYSHILQAPGHVRDGLLHDHAFLHMDGQAVFRFAVRVLEQVSRDALAANGMTISDLDWLVPHQANLRILEATSAKLNLRPEKLIKTVENQGNTSAASVPLALDTAVRDGRIKPGHSVLLEAVGGGMTWGGLLLRM